MTYIVNYCSGGVGNRLKPFGSCYNISKRTNRTLAMTWKPALRCLAPFEKLYKNNVENIDLNNIHSATVSIYSYSEYIKHDYNLNGDGALLCLFNRFGCKSLDNISEIVNDPSEYVVVYNNNVLTGFEDISEFLKTLQPLDFITDKINSVKNELGLNKNIIGVHARGTDFNISPQFYIDKMKQFPESTIFYVASDTNEFENYIQNCFGKERIIIRKNKQYVSKNNNNYGWTNNVLTPIESIQDALVDLYTLAETTFKVYHQDSTFAHIVDILTKR